MKQKQLLLYMPVVHAGYRNLLQAHADADDVLILGDGFVRDFPVLGKEIRALTPRAAAEHASVIVPGRVSVVEPEDLSWAVDCRTLVMPDEVLMHEISDQYNLHVGREVTWERTFLRWDREWSKPQPVAGHEAATDLTDTDLRLMGRARGVAGSSSDWWRQVGAVIRTPDGSVREAYNHHHPSPYSPYVDGDPRNEYSRGVRTDLSTAIHAEASLIAGAAADGVALKGSSIYVSTFPCPACARLIVEAGIVECFFEAPYAMLAGDDVLRSGGVALRWVPVEEQPA